jgi:hypothetical protein
MPKPTGEERSMKVKCIANELSLIHSEAVLTRLRRSIRIDGQIRDLKVGEDYDVQALEHRDGGLWLFLHTVAVSEYPYPYPAEFFELVDGRIPPLWCAKFFQNDDSTGLKRLSFVEWATDDTFYERLVDGDLQCVALYQRRSMQESAL